MKLKRIYNDYIPFDGYLAMVFYPWVFIRNSVCQKYTPTVNRHEVTHALQQLETLWVFFILIYVLEYLIKLIYSGFNFYQAYHSISFEQEAFANQGKVDYNKNRKFYAWAKYIFTMKK